MFIGKIMLSGKCGVISMKQILNRERNEKKNCLWMNLFIHCCPNFMNIPLTF